MVEACVTFLKITDSGVNHGITLSACFCFKEEEAEEVKEEIAFRL